MDASTAKPTRRRFLRSAARTSLGLLGLGTATAAYGFYEASALRISRTTIQLPHLPEAFAGKTIAVLTDLHHGPYVRLSFIEAAVATTNALQPDMVALVGDFAHKGKDIHEQLGPCLNAVAKLTAPLGVFAVPGNHDMAQRGQIYREAVALTPLVDVTNRAERLTRDGQHLWLAGVDDLWYGNPNQEQALQPIPPNAAVIMLCHNPDFVETNPDPRVGLVLCGHTHGGQAYLPILGSPWMPTRYGDKYRHGLVQAEQSQVFVSRGVGEAGMPIRLNCPPEINVLTLQRQDAT
jgi:predicted MPP superfamily phosphohydrolase